jgi:Lrp/AsnC family transcriptional regulator, leucine-responsive regulatory protein
MNATSELDKIDRRILRLLSEDGRMAWRDLADQVGLSLTPTIRRVRLLEERGYIDGYAARLNEERLAGSMTVFVSVTLERQSGQTLSIFEQEVARIPNVMSCYLMTGGADYLLRVVVRDLAEFQRFLSDGLTRIPGVAHIQSSFALKPVLARSATPPL